jgi:hypothetical protein
MHNHITYISFFLKSIQGKNRDKNLSVLFNDLQYPIHRPYIKEALNYFYNELGISYNEINSYKVAYNTLIVIDYLIKSNVISEINLNTTISEFSNFIHPTRDPYNLNNINYDSFLKNNFNRKIVYENNNVSIIALQGDIFNYIDQFNVACLHVSDATINRGWDTFINQTDLITRMDFEIQKNGLNTGALHYIIPTVNCLNYLYLFENTRIINDNQQEVNERLHGCLNEVTTNAPLASNIVFNGLMGENYENDINIQRFLNFLSDYIQNNETNIKTVYIISKNRGILEI